MIDETNFFLFYQPGHQPRRKGAIERVYTHLIPDFAFEWRWVKDRKDEKRPTLDESDDSNK